MKAIDVYEQNKRDIKIISDAMRKEGKPGHIDNIGVLIGSEKYLGIIQHVKLFLLE